MTKRLGYNYFTQIIFRQQYFKEKFMNYDTS